MKSQTSSPVPVELIETGHQNVFFDSTVPSGAITAIVNYTASGTFIFTKFGFECLLTGIAIMIDRAFLSSPNKEEMKEIKEYLALSTRISLHICEKLGNKTAVFYAHRKDVIVLANAAQTYYEECTHSAEHKEGCNRYVEARFLFYDLKEWLSVSYTPNTAG